MAKKKKKKGLPIPPGRGNTTEELIDLLKQSKVKIIVQPDTLGRGSLPVGPSWNVAKRQRARRQQLRNFRRRSM
jgi:hypothetical protein